MSSNPIGSTATNQRSLFGEILDWMLAPLFLLWPLSVAITYVVAQSIAAAPYDRQLASHARMIAQQFRVEAGELRFGWNRAAEDLLRGDQAPGLQYQVLGARGEWLAGDRDLPLPSDRDLPVPGVVQLWEANLRGQTVRLASIWVELRGMPAGSRPALVQVADTPERRQALANEIIKGVILPQFVILPVAVLLVWFGLSRGISPLGTLQARLRARSPADLSPINEREAPQEIAPLVEAINDLLVRLDSSMSAQRRFVADAAHQMKTPLAGLRTQAELALRTRSPEDMQASLHQLINSAERSTRLVNQLLALARAEEAGAHPLPMQAVDLSELARDCTLNWVNEALSRGIDLGLEAEDSIHVSGAPLLMEEALNNLIDNALRYTPRGGSVTVRTGLTVDGQPFIEVDDTGPGIPETERPLVMERFYRILGRGGDGSGLGLAIVREIMDQHDAQVLIEDAREAGNGQGPGARFRLVFRNVL